MKSTHHIGSVPVREVPDRRRLLRAALHNLAVLCLCFSISCTKPIVSPKVLSASDNPALQNYLLWSPNYYADYASITNFPIPFTSEIIRGKIHSADYNTNASLGLITTHLGESWYEQQNVYVASNSQIFPLNLSAAQKRPTLQAFIVSGKNGKDPLLFGEEGGPGDHRLATVWTMRLGDQQVTTVGLADGCWVSPDHTMVLFEHQAPEGRLTYYLWSHETGKVQPLVSIWVVSDSGQSWGEAWSPDSKVIRIKGTSRGYGPRPRKSSKLDLLYVLSENTFYSVPATNELQETSR